MVQTLQFFPNGLGFGPHECKGRSILNTNSQHQSQYSRSQLTRTRTMICPLWIWEVGERPSPDREIWEILCTIQRNEAAVLGKLVGCFVIVSPTKVQWAVCILCPCNNQNSSSSCASWKQRKATLKHSSRSLITDVISHSIKSNHLVTHAIIRNKSSIGMNRSRQRRQRRFSGTSLKDSFFLLGHQLWSPNYSAYGDFECREQTTVACQVEIRCASYQLMCIHKGWKMGSSLK